MSATSTNNRGSQIWAWIPLAYAMPPSMTIPEKDKDSAYHSSWSRYFLSRQYAMWINNYRENYQWNMEYAIDSRWGEDSDVRLFLGDGPSQTSRIPFKFPIMSPMLTRMVGAVDNISIAAVAKPATQQFAQTRREAELLKALNLSTIAGAGPMTEAAYAEMGISPDPRRTEEMFDMTYQDHIVRGANSLMSMLAMRNNLEAAKRPVAAFMALSGVSAFHNFVNGSNIETELCEPREIGWDSSAMKPDLSDAQFVYCCPLMDVGAIGERWNPKADVIRALDLWTRLYPGGYNFNAGWPQSRPRVFTIYWKDFKKVDRGYVMQEDGSIMFCTINEIDEDTGKPKYTDKDLVTPPENKFTRAWEPQELKNKKQSRYIQVVRYCSMIPWEYLPGGYTKGQAYSANLKPTAPPDPSIPNINVAGDIVLDYGEYPLQEADPDDVYSVRFPLKLSTWRLLGGNAVAPMTAARDPQRWINQITSDVAWRLRKAGSVSPAIAKEAIADTNYTEQEIAMHLKEGDPLFLSASQLGGLQNSMYPIDTSPGQGVFNLLGMLPQAKSIAESSIGVYESNYGAPQGQDQLVGTLQLQLQQAGVMQQPFYAAIADLFKQQNQFYAQAGKQFYSRMPWILNQMTGDDDMAALVESKDMQLEQFRVDVKLSMDGNQLRLLTDQQVIPNLMQLGMLDPVTAAQLMGRSIPDDVYAAARKFTKMAQDAQAQQQQQAMQAQEQQALAMEDAMIRDEDAEIAREMTNAELKSQANEIKATAPYRQADSQWLKPDAGGIGTV